MPVDLSIFLTITSPVILNLYHAVVFTSFLERLLPLGKSEKLKMKHSNLL